MDRASRRGRGSALLERLGLAQAAKVRVREFSKGMRQRLGLAQALINAPRLAILDEPMSGLDPVGRRDIREAIAELRRDGVAVFFSSHILSDVEMICDRVGILSRGRLVKEGGLASVLDARVTAIDVALEGVVLDAGAVRPAPTPGQQAVCTLASQKDVDALLASVLAAGGKVVSVAPRRETLEEVFVRTGGEFSSDGVSPAQVAE
jgi:ABC-2 type transport system ATP-binding protein